MIFEVLIHVKSRIVTNSFAWVAVIMKLLNLGLFLLLVATVHSFVPKSPKSRLCTLSCSTVDVAEPKLEENILLLQQAAETRQEDSEKVVAALLALEKQMRQLAKEDPNTASSMRENLNGDWRLIFTTGTVDTQKRSGRVNYFPIKAVQSFREDSTIQNGIYVGNFPVLRFQGTFDFNLKSRKLEFDFDQVKLLNWLDIQLGNGKAAELGAKSGLGSKNNVNAKRKPFFNWISANEKIATARGGGGGLALWKRVE